MGSVCAVCGNSISAGDKFCPVCGKEATASQPAAGRASPSTLESTADTSVVPGRTSNKAIASLVCGLFVFAFPFSIAAVVLGHIALSEIRKSAGRLKGRGMAIVGLVLGYAGLAIVPVLILAAIAIPNLLRARIAANESAAVSSVRIINTAEISYTAAHPDKGYTCGLADLSEGDVISKDLVAGTKYGYNFELSGCVKAGGSDAIAKYKVVAYPMTLNSSGTRAFCSDESAVIRVDQTGSPRECLANGMPLFH